MKKTFEKSKTFVVINYITPSGRGVITCDTGYYQKNIKRFNKALKGCIITNFEERENKDEY